MLPVIWRPKAEADLDEITSYLIGWNPVAALDLETQLTGAAQSLGQFPYIGRPGRVPGMRELWPHPNYCVVYQVNLANVEITAVLHARREYP